MSYPILPKRHILMQKIIIILPYFGKFSNYFNLFLKSCEKNHTIDWAGNYRSAFNRMDNTY